MLADGLKISWRYFRSGFIHNLAILFILIFSNAATLLAIMLKGDMSLSITLVISALLGYVLTTLIAAYATKFRKKEFTVRKMFGVHFPQILMLTSIDSLIHMGASVIFSLIIVEHVYQHNLLLTTLSPLVMIIFFLLLLIVSVLISVFPALRLDAIDPQEL